MDRKTSANNPVVVKPDESKSTKCKRPSRKSKSGSKIMIPAEAKDVVSAASSLAIAFAEIVKAFKPEKSAEDCGKKKKKKHKDKDDSKKKKKHKKDKKKKKKHSNSYDDCNDIFYR